MTAPDFTQTAVFGNKTVIFEIFFQQDFSRLSHITQVYGFIFNSRNGLLIVSPDNVHWTLPGGSTNQGESPLDTLNREVYEESAVKLAPGSIKGFYYQDVYVPDGSKRSLEGSQVRFIARIERQDKFISDPDEGEIKFQKFIKLAELKNYLEWGDLTDIIINKLKV